MSRQRRITRLTPSCPPLTPDFGSAAVIKIKPDTKTEKALYRMLVQERRKYERLLCAHQDLQAIFHDRKIRREINKLVRQMKPKHNDSPKGCQ